MARIDLDDNDQVRVLVRRGRVEAEPLRGPMWRGHAGEMLFMREGERRVRLRDLDRGELDAFDDWSDDRIAYYMDRRLPRGVNRYLPGIYELGDYGEWLECDGARCWRPRRVPAEWRPYLKRKEWAVFAADDLAPWRLALRQLGAWLFRRRSFGRALGRLAAKRA